MPSIRTEEELLPLTDQYCDLPTTDINIDLEQIIYRNLLSIRVIRITQRTRIYISIDIILQERLPPSLQISLDTAILLFGLTSQKSTP